MEGQKGVMCSRRRVTSLKELGEGRLLGVVKMKEEEFIDYRISDFDLVVSQETVELLELVRRRKIDDPLGIDHEVIVDPIGHERRCFQRLCASLLHRPWWVHRRRACKVKTDGKEVGLPYEKRFRLGGRSFLELGGRGYCSPWTEGRVIRIYDKEDVRIMQCNRVVVRDRSRGMWVTATEVER